MVFLFLNSCFLFELSLYNQKISLVLRLVRGDLPTNPLLLVEALKMRFIPFEERKYVRTTVWTPVPSYLK